MCAHSEFVSDASSIKCNERATTVLGNNVRRESDNGSLSAVSDVKVPKREESKVMQEELNDTFENEKVKEEEKKKLKGRQKIKIKKRNLNEITGDFTCKNDAECLMEIKGKEMSDNYETKNVNSVSSDVKQSDVKLILLGAKCRDADASKINEEDLPTLQEIKEKNGNEEDLEKFLNHIRDSKVKEGLKISNGLLKINSDKIRKEDVKMNKSAKEIIKDIKLNKKEIKPNSDRESLKSTDEENDIKRFSEFLSKNKNIEEKKKCLEEVRNYFDRKRRTRLTKRRCNDDCKIQKREDGPLEKKDDFPKEKSSPTKETVISGKEKKGAYVPCNEEVVEKAVSETLQKFMNLYHFHVSPSVMGTMRKNILEAIQFDSVDSNSSKKNLTPQGNSSENPPGETIQVLGVKNSENFKNLNEETELQVALNPEIVAPSEPLLNTDFEELKKPQFKALGTSAKIQMTHPLQEKNAVESENFKRLKKELENCLEPAQPEADEIGLKIQSLVLENEETSQAKGERFVYDFSKKSLEFAQLDFNPEKPSLRGNNDTKKNQDVETQTYSKPEPIKKSIRIQTIAFFGGREQGLQTDDAIYANNYAQTEFADNELKILSDLNDLEISPGLYRLVKSKNIGRFYLYPEKNKSLEMETSANDVDFSASKCKHYDSFLGESAGGKKLMLKGKLTKEMRILYKEKDSGKIYGTKKKNTTKSTSQRFHRKKSPNADDSVSCLFFRKAVNDSQSCEMSSQLEQEFSLSNVDASPESIQVTSRDDHFGCIWFWNGEKITPGSDLKTRVEDLLKEKLNEINHLSKNSIKINETSRIEDKTSPSQVPRTKTSQNRE